MLRKLALGLVAAASLGAMALVPSALPHIRGVDGAAAGLALAVIITISATPSASASPAMAPTAAT
jgi:hypothetical protein